MAVFMINICKFNGCGITFPRLLDLIEHIEDVHIDYDPAVIEQKEASQPACIPLSYVLRFFTEATKREIQNMGPAPDVRRRLLSAPQTPSVRSSTPTGSELDEEELVSQSEDSNDSWTTADEYSSEYILRYGVKMGNAQTLTRTNGQDKPFACPVPGCKKRYKNVNGIKYHSKNGHKKDGKVKKGYKCQCGKSYKTAQGLKNHSANHNIGTIQPTSIALTATSQVSPLIEPPKVLGHKMSGLVVTASPSSRQLNMMESLDGNKLVRIYDSIKTKELIPSFTLPKHNIAGLNIVGANQTQSIHYPNVITSNSTPASSPTDKSKIEVPLKVHMSDRLVQPFTQSYSNELAN